MARNLKWQMKFKSFKGVNCTVNIYKRGYEGTTVKQLIGGADPISWDEDDSKKITNWIHPKTGYINVIEETSGDLFDLYPDDDTSHYVEAYYGETLEFTGYMQAQEVSQPWEPAPLELSFPIQSPLALLDNFKFSTKQNSLLTPAQLMKEVIQELNASYERIIYPRTASTNNVYPWTDLIPSEIVCPHKELKPYGGVRNINYLYEPETFTFFLEGICAQHCWQLHDCGKALVFNKEDFDGDYYNLLVSNLDNPTVTTYDNVTGSALNTVARWWQEADDAPTLSMIRPYKNVTPKLQGDKLDKVELTKYNWHDRSGTMKEGGYGYNTLGAEISATWQHKARFDDVLRNRNIINDGYGLYPLTVAQQNGNSYSCSDKYIYLYMPNETLGYMLQWKPWPRIPMWYMYIMKMKIKLGDNVQSMSDSWGTDRKVVLNFRFKYGNKYYDPLYHRLYETPRDIAIEFDRSTGKPIVDNSSYQRYQDKDGYIVDLQSEPSRSFYNDSQLEVYISINDSSVLATGQLIEIEELKLERLVDDDNYQTDEEEAELTYHYNGIEDLTYDVNFHCNPWYSNFIEAIGGSDNEHRYTALLPPGVGTKHFFIKQKFTSDKATFTIPYSEYMFKFLYWKDSLRWRVWSISRSMRDDQSTITFKSI